MTGSQKVFIWLSMILAGWLVCWGVGAAVVSLAGAALFLWPTFFAIAVPAVVGLVVLAVLTYVIALVVT